jgi:hypothetical protein
MLSNNKFLGKCWFGGHPWIRLAMDCERMVEKGINFIFCLGTTYDIYLAWKVLGITQSFSLMGKVCLQKKLSLNLSFELGHLYKSLPPSAKDLSIYFMQFFIFI